MEKEIKAIYDKSYTCPVCEKKFTSKTVRTGHVHMLHSEYDLRPVYDTVDQVKYEVVSCPNCGCSATAKNFDKISYKSGQKIKAVIGDRYKPVEWGKSGIYTHDEAKLRFKLALICAMAKDSKNSEKAYLNLKLAWVHSGEIDALKKSENPDLSKIKEDEKLEKEFRGKALEGFIEARQKENFPVAGMDEDTLDYLMAALFLNQERFGECSRYLGAILIRQTISSNLRNKAKDLKQLLNEKIKENEE